MRSFIHPILKKVAIRLFSFDLDVATIAAYLDISEPTVYRIRNLWVATGDIVRIPVSQGRPRILGVSQSDEKFVTGLVQRRKDMFLDEIQTELEISQGVSASRSTISRTLKRQGYTRKKVTKEAIERDEQRRADFVITIGMNYTPEQLVFVDESAVDKRVTYRTNGWSMKGTKVTRKGHFVRGRRYSILPALSLDGVLDTCILEGSFTGPAFEDFVIGLLDEMNPFPQPNSVLVMDNAAIHKSPNIRELVEARGSRLVYLPPYSPDYNPIEEGFSALKAWIRRNGDLVRDALASKDPLEGADILLTGVNQTMTAENAYGWYKDCGYHTETVE